MKNVPTLTDPEVEQQARKAGLEGALWRLAQMIGPSKVGAWIDDESGRIPPITAANMAYCIAEVAAADFMVFGLLTSDPRGAIMGPQGVKAAFDNLLKQKMDQQFGGGLSPSGLIIPAHVSSGNKVGKDRKI